MQIEQWAVTKSLCHTAFKVFFLQNEMKMKEHLSYKEQRPKNIIENLFVIRVWGGKPHRQKV